VKVILDAGAFVAIERRDRRIEAMLRVLHEQRVPLWTSAAVVAQVWRNGRKQVLLARILPAVGVRPLASGDDTRIGELLAVTRTNDVIDGHVALLADDADLAALHRDLHLQLAVLDLADELPRQIGVDPLPQQDRLPQRIS
jgi:hypothetical protein